MNTIAMSIHSVQIVLLTYHFPLRESRETAVFRVEMREICLEYVVILDSEKIIREHQSHVQNTQEST